MKTLIGVCFATIYGLSLRIMFGFFNNLMGIMSVSFLILAPAIIGFITIILIPKEKTTSVSSAFFKPWLTSLVILIVTMLLSIEGSICWIMIYPLFAILSGIGGVIAYYVRKQNSENSNDNDWEKPNSLNISFLLFIPAFVGLIEGDKTLTPKDFNISKSIEIPASAKDVWFELTNINDINIKEKRFSLSKFMGFPKHLRTTIDTLAIGGRRKAIYENGLYFDETISKFETEKLLVLDIKTDPDNIPPTVMDEHIVIGGKHVDILKDIYTIEKLSDNSCRLTLASHFYINTPFNWYAGIWAKYLMEDILQDEINLIKIRATNQF